MKRLVSLILCVIFTFACVSCNEETPKEEFFKPYYIFLYNSGEMTEDDISAIDGLSELYREHDIVVIDVDGLSSSAEVYARLQEEKNAMLGELSGVQIFGTPQAVPSFELKFETEIFPLPGESEISTYDNFVSDFFYSNLNNDPDKLNELSAYGIANAPEEFDIFPEWAVVRLPLSSGQFSAFFQKYREYLDLKTETYALSISVASPIFPVGWYPVASDDFGYFLMRARDEWGLVNDLRMYGTTEGVCASTLELDGSCNARDWAHLTNDNLCEIYHDSHANKIALLETVFFGKSKSDYHCEEILYAGTINGTLKGKPYFLNTNGCDPAKDMEGSIVNAALRGRCVGAFASTSLMNNVDVDCMISEEEYAEGYTKFSFYYEYLSAKADGKSRAESFLAGQRQISTSLTEKFAELHPNSFQSNLNNLLSFHNFGLIDP